MTETSQSETSTKSPTSRGQSELEYAISAAGPVLGEALRSSKFAPIAPLYMELLGQLLKERQTRSFIDAFLDLRSESYSTEEELEQEPELRTLAIATLKKHQSKFLQAHIDALTSAAAAYEPVSEERKQEIDGLIRQLVHTTVGGGEIPTEGADSSMHGKVIFMRPEQAVPQPFDAEAARRNLIAIEISSLLDGPESEELRACFAHEYLAIRVGGKLMVHPILRPTRLGEPLQTGRDDVLGFTDARLLTPDELVLVQAALDVGIFDDVHFFVWHSTIYTGEKLSEAGQARTAKIREAALNLFSGDDGSESSPEFLTPVPDFLRPFEPGAPKT